MIREKKKKKKMIHQHSDIREKKKKKKKKKDFSNVSNMTAKEGHSDLFEKKVIRQIEIVF